MSSARRYPSGPGRNYYLDVWHRKDNIQHLIGSEAAKQLTMIDLDSVEYCRSCYQTLAFIEVKDIDEEEKYWIVTAELALRLGVPGYLLEVELNDQGIERFWLTTLDVKAPCHHPISEQEWAELLWQHHVDHLPYCKGRYK